MINKNKKIKGFTLIELLVAIAVIGILSAIAIVGIMRAREKARIARVQSDLNTIYRAMQAMAIDTDKWPGHQEPDAICSNLPSGCPVDNEIEDLGSEKAGLLQDDSSDPYDNWQGPYLEIMMKDPWDHNYFLDTDYDINLGAGTDMKAVLGSYGPDGKQKNGYDPAPGTFAKDDVIKILPAK